MLLLQRWPVRLWFDVEKQYKTTRFREAETILRLWFDVEKQYKTTLWSEHNEEQRLWFDVEKQYKTTKLSEREYQPWLWFDVEKKYKTTQSKNGKRRWRCGLMWKRNIRQPTGAAVCRQEVVV